MELQLEESTFFSYKYSTQSVDAMPADVDMLFVRISFLFARRSHQCIAVLKPDLSTYLVGRCICGTVPLTPRISSMDQSHSVVTLLYALALRTDLLLSITSIVMSATVFRDLRPCLSARQECSGNRELIPPSNHNNANFLSTPRYI
jgi:hypothetical protein